MEKLQRNSLVTFNLENIHLLSSPNNNSKNGVAQQKKQKQKQLVVNPKYQRHYKILYLDLSLRDVYNMYTFNLPERVNSLEAAVFYDYIIFFILSIFLDIFLLFSQIDFLATKSLLSSILLQYQCEMGISQKSHCSIVINLKLETTPLFNFLLRKIRYLQRNLNMNLKSKT